MDYAVGVLKRHRAVMELDEPVPQRLLDHQVRQIVRRREHVIGQDPVGVQQAKPVEGAPRALGYRL